MKQQTLTIAADAQSGFEQYCQFRRRGESIKTMDTLSPPGQRCTRRLHRATPNPEMVAPIGLERMLRIHFIQHWFIPAALAFEESLCVSVSLAASWASTMGREPVPDASILPRFRRLLNAERPPR